MVEKCENLYDGITRYYALIPSATGWKMVHHMKIYRTRKAAEQAFTEDPVKPSKLTKRNRRKK